MLHPSVYFLSFVLLQRSPVLLPFPWPFPWLPLIPMLFISILPTSAPLSLCFVLQCVPILLATGNCTGAGCSPGGEQLLPTESSYHQLVRGISPSSQTPTAASKIQLSAELAESRFHHKTTHVLPESCTVIGTAWPERSRQLSPWSASRNAGRKTLLISYLGLLQCGLGLQNLEIPGKLMLYICLRWRPAWTTMGFSPWPVWNTLFLAEQLSLTVICEVSSRFHSVVCMAALFSGEIFTLACLAAEMIYCSASTSWCCFAVGGVCAVSISLMSCSPPHPLRGLKSVKWEQHLVPSMVTRDYQWVFAGRLKRSYNSPGSVSGGLFGKMICGVTASYYWHLMCSFYGQVLVN